MNITRTILHSLLISIVMAAKDYGYFEFKVNGIKTCQGPKHNDCCINNVNVQSGNLVTYDMNCVENVTPTKAKIVASAKNRQKLRLQMDKPCNHVFVKPLLVTLFNATNDCIIAKNIYRFTVDYAEIAQTYYSGMFLYGNWTFQSVLFNDHCNFLCTIIDVNMYPKKEH